MTVSAYHTAIDEALGRIIAANPPHLKPCCTSCVNPHCCSESAYADASEVQGMLDTLNPEQRAYVEAGARRWLSVFGVNPMLKEEMPSAFPYRLLNLPCPFLKEGRCLAYEHRPMGCREFFALGNPEDCAMPARIHQKFATFPHPNLMDRITLEFSINRTVELDHISGHLVRILLGDPTFTTGSHQRIEITTEPEPA